MPYIVRVERGTMNRGIYDIAVLFDPTRDDASTGWKPYAPQPGWNRKVVYSFGASSNQPRLQFRSEQTWTDDSALALGFMVAISSMTDSLYNSNRVLNAETLMMMKEHIGDTYGDIRYTLGNGCSGGSINQLTAASIYPGLLDGIQPTCTYPDSQSTALEVGDCERLVRFYVKPEWAALMTGLTQAQINAKKAAINGHKDQTGCHAWFNTFAFVDRPGNFLPEAVVNGTTGAIAFTSATPRNNCQLPLALVWDPVTNPNGVRCSGPDYAVSVWGTYAGSNRARVTRDNVGVQYGLKALVAGAITAEEFVVLNERIGGIDADLNSTAARSTADLDAIRIAYQAGIVSDGKHLGETPMIDLRGYDDSNIPPPAGSLGIHHIWRSFSLRARLDAANGNHDNHVMWRYGTGLVAPNASGLRLQSFLTIDQWVAGIVGRHWRRHDRAEDPPQQAAPGVRLLLSHERHHVHDQGDGLRRVRHRPVPEAALLTPASGRRTAHRERPQVPAQAPERRRLFPGRAHRIAARPSGRSVSRRRVRLEQAGRGAGAGDLAARLQQRAGWRSASPAAGVDAAMRRYADRRAAP
jgi:hypothetical protein